MDNIHNILLMTATGGYNLGDELILLQEYTFLRQRYPLAKITVFTYDQNSSLLPKDDLLSYIYYFPHALKSQPITNIGYLWKNISAIFSCDMVVIGGGELIYDQEIQSVRGPLLYWAFRVALARLFKKRVVYFALGINLHKPYKKLLSLLFKGKHIFCSVRDKKSQQTLTQHNIEAALVEDSVFLYEKQELHNIVSTRPKVGISLRHGYLPHEQENMHNIIAYLQNKGYDVVFISHSFHASDALANDYLLAKKLFPECAITKTLQETLDIYPSLSYVVGMRLHSMILSFVHAIPFIGLSYSKKTNEFFSIINSNFLISTQNFSFQDFCELFEKLENDADSTKFAFIQKSGKIKGQLLHTLNAFFDGVEKSWTTSRTSSR